MHGNARGIGMEIEEKSPEVVFKSARIIEHNYDDANTTIEGIITSESMDRDKDIVYRDGVDIKRYLNNPIVLWNHDHNTPIGKSEKMRKTKLEDGTKILKAKTKFAKTQFAQDLYQMVKEGILNAFSIGFIPTEMESRKDDNGHGWNIYKSELLEYSLVSVPANPDAIVTSKLLKSLRDFPKETQEKFTKGADLMLVEELNELRTELDEKYATIDLITKTLVTKFLQVEIQLKLNEGLLADPNELKLKIEKEFGL